jgi:hypothetical protein
VTPLSQFADVCGTDLPGMPAPQLDKLIREISRELLREGRMWRYTLPDIPLVAPTLGPFQTDNVYPLNLPTDQAMIHDIPVVLINGLPIDPISRDATRVPDSTTFWTRVDQSNILIRSDPGAGALSVTVVLIPIPTAIQLPDILFNEWIEAVQHGVNFKGMSQPKKEWSDFFVFRGRMRPGLGLQENKEKYAIDLDNARSYARGGGATQRRRTLDGFQA